MLKEMTGHHGNWLIILNMQYGLKYSGPGKDILSEDRAIGNASSVDKRAFLHDHHFLYVARYFQCIVTQNVAKLVIL